MTNLNNDISSLDYIKDTIYNSKLSKWLANDVLTSLMSKNDWKLKTADNPYIFLDYIGSNNFKFIRCKFNIGMIHVGNEEGLDAIIDRIMDYAERPDFIAHLFSETIRSNDVTFIQLTYEGNIYQGMDVPLFFDLMFDQIEKIKVDMKFMLSLKLFDTEYDDEEGEEDDETEDKTPLNPYDGGIVVDPYDDSDEENE